MSSSIIVGDAHISGSQGSIFGFLSHQLGPSVANEADKDSARAMTASYRPSFAESSTLPCF